MEEQEQNFNSGMIFLKPHEQLRKILDQYPNDGQILKELIQNADDAGASEIKFLYDKWSYPTGTLIKRRSMAKFQGPALYAYNDAIFEEEDWAGIRMVCRSTKEKNPLKVGRFGLGFKSVYHLTDLPGFMSQNRIAFLDPHERYFEEDMDRTTAKAWNMNDKGFQTYPDQFKPFKIDLFKTDDVFEKGYYPQTLFRFPLRQENSDSKISNTVYDEGAMEDLFDSFKGEAHMVLLFLKSLEKIELYQRNENSAQPQLLYTVQMSSKCLKSVNEKREELLENLKTKKKSTITYTVDIETIDYKDGIETNHETSSWMVTQFYEGSEMPHRLSLVSLKKLPLVGIAAPITSSPEGAHGICVTRDAIAVNGHVFCFLPLPLPPGGSSLTGLPFHVNGYFAVDQNRKHLKWATSGKTKDQDILWNQHLISTMLPQALLGLIQGYLRVLHTCNDLAELKNGVEDKEMGCSICLSHLFSVMKDIKTLDSRWKSVMDIPTQIMALKMFFSKNQGGIWVDPSQAVFDSLDLENVDNFTRRTIRLLTEPSTYFIVQIPPSALQFCQCMFLKINTEMEYLQPIHVSEAVKQFTPSISLKQMAAITNYIGSDLVIDLKLLPLADKTTSCYRKRPKYLKDVVFIQTNDFPMTLLPGMEKKFVNPEFQNNKTLLQVAEQDHTQVCHLTKPRLDQFVKDVFPPSWTSPVEVWYPGCSGYPSEEWFKNIWTYLYRHHSSSLDAFENLHLLPDFNTTPKRLLQLSKANPVIGCGGGSNTMSAAVADILGKLNCATISGMPKYVTQHPKIGTFVTLHLDASSLLSILQRLSQSGGFWKSITTLNAEEKCTLRRFIASFPMDPQFKNLLVKLPIFPTWNGTNTSTFVSLQDNLKGSPQLGQLFLGLKFRSQFLDLSEKNTSILARQCLVHPIPIIKLIEKYLLHDIETGNFYSRQEGERIMIDIFNNLSTSQIKSLKNVIRDLRFLPSMTGALHSPNELYDPEDKLIQTLIMDQNKFPSIKWKMHVPILREMGLKSRKDIPPSEIHLIAKNIEESQSTTQSEALLTFLLEFPKILSEKRLFGQYTSTVAISLKRIRWVECLQERPSNYPSALYWKGEERTLATPSEVTSRRNAALCGSKLFVIKSDEKCQSLTQLFGWRNPPPINTVLQHLQQVISNHSDSDGTEDSTFSHVSKEIYAYISQGDEHHYPIEWKIEESGLTNWVWHGNGFVKPSAVLIRQHKLQLDMKPYFYDVPNELKVFEHFFVQCGAVIEDNETAVSVLEKMKLECADQPLDKKKLSIAVKLLEELAGFITDGHLRSLIDLENSCGKLYIPNKERVLKESQTLCYDPTGYTNPEPDSDMDLVHLSVSPQVAQQLGLSTRRQTLANRFIEPFGQTEDLTTRIRGLLKGYPFDAEILKELLQNADDSEATEIHFVLDPREHPKEHLISDSWSHLQGPALLVYNNKPFTQHDLKGIQNLGLGSKGDDPSKTGQYGVGFNCVYHLTDVPTFLTTVPGRGKLLCAFDPNCAFVKDVDRRKPGGIIDYESKIKFPNVFVPYIENIFDTNHGTLFRFPLRSEEMLQYSEISKHSVDATKIHELFEVFMKEVKDSLLFLNSIQKVTISSVDKQTGDLKQMYQVEATIPQEDKQKVERMRIATKQASKCTEIKDIKWQCEIYNMEIKEDKKQKKKWKIAKCLGISGKVIPPIVDNAFRRGDLGLSPTGGIAVPLDKQMTSYNGKLYCFLPLPIDTRLPVHVNGHFALDHENRRTLWKSGRHADSRTEWNDILFTDTLARTYAHLLEFLKPGSSDSLSWYYGLFPTNYSIHGGDSDDYIHQFKRAVYEWIGKDKREVLSVHRGDTLQWYAPHTNHVYFDDLRGQIPEEWPLTTIQTPKHTIVRETLLDCGLNLLSTPMVIYRCFQNADVNVPLICAEEVVEFFKNYNKPFSPCTLKHMPIPLTETTFKTRERYSAVLDYCLRSKRFCQNPDSVPLLLTLDEKLNAFSCPNPKFTIPLTGFLTMLEETQQNLFVHPSILQDLSVMKTQSLRPFGIKDFAIILTKIFDKNFTQGRKTAIEPSDGTYRFFHKLWNLLSFILKEEDARSMEDLQVQLKPLKDLSILPVFNPGREGVYLVPISMASDVVEMDIGQEATEPLRNIFRKFGMQELFKKAMNEESIDMVQKLVATIDSPGLLLKVMGESMKQAGHMMPKLSTKEARKILTYMCDNLKKIEKIPLSSNILRELPLYEDFSGQLVSLSGKAPHIVPSIVQKDGLAHLMEAKNYIFLRHDQILEDLYKFIACKSLSIYQLYKNVIFPTFDYMSQEEKISHLYFLSTYVSCSETDNKNLLKTLQSLNFIKTGRSDLAPVCHFLDPRVPVFMQFEDDKLLPKCWREIKHHTDKPWTEWHSFLTKLGLQTKPNKSQIVGYAEKIERMYNVRLNEEAIMNLKELSTSIVRCLFQDMKTLDRQLMSDIKHIKFIPLKIVSEDKRRLHPQHDAAVNQGLVLTCFNGAVLPNENENLCWTTTSILESQTLQDVFRYIQEMDRMYICKQLGIKSVDVNIVLHHLQNLCIGRKKVAES